MFERTRASQTPSENRLAGHEAYAVTFDVADIDQLQLSKGQGRHRVRLVLVRTQFAFSCRRHDLPVVMVAGYSNLPEDFEGLLGDFHQFLERITIGKATGAEFRAPVPSQPQTAAVTAPPAQPSAAPPPAEAQPPAAGTEHIAPPPDPSGAPSSEVMPSGSAAPR